MDRGFAGTQFTLYPLRLGNILEYRNCADHDAVVENRGTIGEHGTLTDDRPAPNFRLAGAQDIDQSGIGNNFKDLSAERLFLGDFHNTCCSIVENSDSLVAVNGSYPTRQRIEDA